MMRKLKFKSLDNPYPRKGKKRGETIAIYLCARLYSMEVKNIYTPE
jgi:hypothetical protein